MKKRKRNKIPKRKRKLTLPVLCKIQQIYDINKTETNKIKSSKEQKDMLNILASNIDLTEKCVFMLLQAIILYT